MSLVSVNSSTRTNEDEKPFYCTIELNQPVNRVKRIELVSMELPVGWYNVSASIGNNYLLFSPVGKCTITDGFYTLDDLIDEINSSLPSSYTIAQYTYSKLMTLTPASNAIFYSTMLSQQLGFGNEDKTATFFTATYPPRVMAYDLYANFHIANLPSNYNSKVPCTFKIPITVDNNYVQYVNEMTDPSQSIDFQTPQTISQLKVRVYNVDGVLLDNNAMDWSATLRFITEKGEE
jgi:hypothetical protein